MQAKEDTMTLGEFRALLEQIPREYDSRVVWADEHGEFVAIDVDAEGVCLLASPVRVEQPPKAGVLVVNRVLVAELVP
jgi:hypothetical protein